MIDLLIENQSFEVRESFAKLLTTAIRATTKNEEGYFFKVIPPLYDHI